MSEFDFLEPIAKTVMSVQLPSRGVLYPKEHPASKGQLTLSPMTMLEEAMFFEDDSATLTSTVDKVLKRCLQDHIDVNGLITSDKFFLFMMLRAVTYGSEYTFEWVCRALNKKGAICGNTNNTTIKIPDNFSMKYLADDDKEPFIITLPDTQKEIAFKLLRGVDEPKIDAHTMEIEKMREDGIMKVDTTSAFRLMLHILEVDGKSVEKAPQDKLLAFVLSLPARDRQYLQQKINLYTPGLNTDVKVRCEVCGAQNEMDLPFTANFFRSSISDEDEGRPMDDEI